MRISRFFHPSLLSVDQVVNLSPDAANHCGNVLRLKIGSGIVLFDGSGKEFACELSDVQKRQVQAVVMTELHIDPQSPTHIHLAQGVSKGDRMEWVLQKATELGVTHITPIITERCNVKLDEARWQKKMLQWRKVIIGACEQSGRNTLPLLKPPTPLKQFAADSTKDLRLILSPSAKHGLGDLASPSQYGYRLLVGPEGGLSDGEIHQLIESGYKDVRFGPRVLRTETAAIAALAVLQYKVGDLM